MIGCMIRSKTIAAAALFYQKPYMKKEIRIIAGPKTVKAMFEHISACHISDGYGSYKKQYPPRTFAFEIEQNKSSEEQIKRSPVLAIAKKRHQAIKNRISQYAIELDKQPLIPLLQSLQKS